MFKLSTTSSRSTIGLQASTGMVRGAAAFGIVSALALAPVPAQAGFFEQLFGLQPAPEAQPSYAPPQDYGYVPRRAPRPVRKRVVVDTIGSGKQTPTDLMHDKTLRQGDAVMMKDGMHVYAGGSRAAHEPVDFVPLDRSGLPRKERVALASVDTTRASVATPDAGAAGTLASGRSAAVGAPVIEGRMITDVRGKQLRYVGP